MNCFREDNKQQNVTVPSIDTVNYGKLFANFAGVENLMSYLWLNFSQIFSHL